MQRISSITFLALAYALMSPPAQATDRVAHESLSDAQNEVLSVVETRWQAWLDNDVDAYLAVHHDSWRRWALDAPGLDKKEDIAAFWGPVEDDEQMLSFSIEPIAVYLFGNDEFAVAHYIGHEVLKSPGLDTAGSQEQTPVPDSASIAIRFSDFFVRSEGRWLYIGGYRDGACALSPEIGPQCDH